MSHQRSTPTCPFLAILAAAFLSGFAVAQEPAISVVPRNGGPVGISDLGVLLGSDLQFQILDFEMEEAFCLVLGYTHEIDGRLRHRSPRNGVVCNEAGPQRLVVVVRPIDEKRRLMFGLHDREVGTGGTWTFADLPIGASISGSATFRLGGNHRIRTGVDSFSLAIWAQSA